MLRPSLVFYSGLLMICLGAAPMTRAAEPPEKNARSIEALDIEQLRAAHHEIPDQPYIPLAVESRETHPARVWRRGTLESRQVNVDGEGRNIVGDAANEPSIAVDPNNAQRLAIGWRQFDNISSSFRQAGFGSSSDGGQTWTAGVIDPGVFRSDPVLDSDADGNFYYNSLTASGGNLSCDVYRSSDGGASWDDGVYAFGGDKQWMVIDRSEGLGAGHVYSNWSQFASCCGPNSFTRSIDSGESYESPVSIPQTPVWGTTAVAPDGTVYVAGSTGSGVVVIKSATLRDPGLPPAFDTQISVNLGGNPFAGGPPNPGGLMGQVWVAVDPSPERLGWVYVLASVDPAGADPLDVHFIRSTDGGQTWSAPVSVSSVTTGYQWFGTLSVAPNGRLDVIWNDTRNAAGGTDSELFYASSQDGGSTWTEEVAVSPSFDPLLGWPQQNKLGDYYDMVSHNEAAHVAYAATFNGEQDVYYLQIPQGPEAEIFADGFESGDAGAWSSAP